MSISVTKTVVEDFNTLDSVGQENNTEGQSDGFITRPETLSSIIDYYDLSPEDEKAMKKLATDGLNSGSGMDEDEFDNFLNQVKELSDSTNTDDEVDNPLETLYLEDPEAFTEYLMDLFLSLQQTNDNDNDDEIDTTKDTSENDDDNPLETLYTEDPEVFMEDFMDLFLSLQQTNDNTTIEDSTDADADTAVGGEAVEDEAKDTSENDNDDEINTTKEIKEFIDEHSKNLSPAEEEALQKLGEEMLTNDFGDDDALRPKEIDQLKAAIKAEDTDGNSNYKGPTEYKPD